MNGRRLFLLIFGCLLAIVTAQNLGTPRNAGPDEPAHIVRGAGLVRGSLFGEETDEPAACSAADVAHAEPSNSSVRRFDVPGWVAQPCEVCFAHDENRPADCAEIDENAERGVISTAARYPIWSHLLPGIATLLVPSSSALWLARFLHALVPTILLAAALARLLEQRRVLAGSAVLLAATPMVLFLVATVNPSGVVVAGSIALWVAGDELVRTRSAPDWLLPASFAALVLPRDDGLLWAALTIGVLWLANRFSPAAVWRSLPAVAKGIGVAVAAIGALWALLASGDLVPVARPDAPGTFAELVVQRTGRHLREAVGVLGWLDTPLPESMYALWFLAAGLVVMVPLILRDHRRAVAALAAIGSFVVVGWVLETVQGRTAGLFWQGRYALPMLAGFVLIAGLVAGADRVVGPIAAFLPAVLAVVVWNVSFLQALRRFGVGAHGSIRPWAWDTWGAPLPLELLIVIHVAASVVLLAQLWTRRDRTTTPTGPAPTIPTTA